MGRTGSSLVCRFPPQGGGRSPLREERLVGRKTGRPSSKMVVVVAAAVVVVIVDVVVVVVVVAAVAVAVVVNVVVVVVVVVVFVKSLKLASILGPMSANLDPL